MHRPARYSQWAGQPWLREDRPDGTSVSWRPPRSVLRSLPDGIAPVATVVCTAADTLHSLAARHYHGLDRPEQLWWLIAEANDIVDPTLSLDGTTVHVPPLSLLEEG